MWGAEHSGDAATLVPLGEVSERPKERDWKSRTCRKVGRGFESLPLRSAWGSPRFPHEAAYFVVRKATRSSISCSESDWPKVCGMTFGW